MKRQLNFEKQVLGSPSLCWSSPRQSPQLSPTNYNSFLKGALHSEKTSPVQSPQFSNQLYDSPQLSPVRLHPFSTVPPMIPTFQLEQDDHPFSPTQQEQRLFFWDQPRQASYRDEQGPLIELSNPPESQSYQFQPKYINCDGPLEIIDLEESSPSQVHSMEFKEGIEKITLSKLAEPIHPDNYVKGKKIMKNRYIQNTTTFGEWHITAADLKSLEKQNLTEAILNSTLQFCCTGSAPCDYLVLPSTVWFHEPFHIDNCLNAQEMELIKMGQEKLIISPLYEEGNWVFIIVRNGRLIELFDPTPLKYSRRKKQSIQMIFKKSMPSVHMVLKKAFPNCVFDLNQAFTRSSVKKNQGLYCFYGILEKLGLVEKNWQSIEGDQLRKYMQALFISQ